MNASNASPRSPRSTPAQRARLLAAFARSGLSAAAFARRHGLHYTTFCAWRQRRARAKTAPAFLQVEVPAPTAPPPLLIELGRARLRLDSEHQVPLAVQLLQRFNLTLATC
jgi:transposase-like protein